MKNIIVIGSGIAGLTCAIKSASLGNHVYLVSPYVSERSLSVMAEGGINAAIDTLNGDSFDVHFEDSKASALGIENDDDLRKMCERAEEMIDFLRGIGTAFSCDEGNKPIVRAFGGQSKKRTLYAGTSTGKQIVSALVRKAREYEAEGLIERLTGYNFYMALIKDSKCYGALLLDKDENLVDIYADALVIAAGGLGKLLGKTTGSELNDGYVASRLYIQGVELRNLEFIQYHPTTVDAAGKKLLISEAARAEGGRLYYLDGDKRVYFLEDKYGEKGNLLTRDILSREIDSIKKDVYLDISFLGEEKIKKDLFEIYDMCKTYIGIDITKESIKVEPGIHFFMGGIRVNSKHETNIKNIYAIGECASKYHGANRLGGNSLLAAVYSGFVSSEAINELNTKNDEIDFSSAIDYENKYIEALKGINLCHMKYELSDVGEVLSKALGITRNEALLKRGFSDIEALKASDLRNLYPFDPNVSVYKRIRRSYELVLAEAIIVAALSRKESRGAHFRSDYPKEDKEYEASSVLSYVNGQIYLRYVEENDKQ